MITLIQFTPLLGIGILNGTLTYNGSPITFNGVFITYQG